MIETPNTADTRYLAIDSQRVGFREHENTAVDVWQFLDTAERFEALPFDRVLTVHEATSIERATGLFRGHLLEGESIFDEVTLIESERLTALQIGLLERLMLHHRRNENWHAAASTGHHILRLDNCREHVHREIMACHLATGDRPAAIRQFSACAATLAEELNIGPMRETLDLNDRIRSGALCDSTQIERKGCAIGEV